MPTVAFPVPQFVTAQRFDGSGRAFDAPALNTKSGHEVEVSFRVSKPDITEDWNRPASGETRSIEQFTLSMHNWSALFAVFVKAILVPKEAKTRYAIAYLESLPL